MYQGSHEIGGSPTCRSAGCNFFFFFTLVTGPRGSLLLKLSDTRVYGPQIRALLETIAHFCRVVVDPQRPVLWFVVVMPVAPRAATGLMGLVQRKHEFSNFEVYGVGSICAPCPLRQVKASGRSTTRAEDAEGTPTPSHISPSILVYEDKCITKDFNIHITNAKLRSLPRQTN